MKYLLLFLALTTLILRFTSHANAQEASVGIYPAIIQSKAETGAVVNTPLTIINGSDHDTEVSLSLKGFNIKDRNLGTIEFYPDENTPDKLGSFLKSVELLDQNTPVKSINLYPKESRTLQISFPVNETSSEEYYFSIVASTVPNVSSEQTSASTSAGIASLVFISLNESENLYPEIKEFSTPTFHTDSPIEFRLETFNTGDHFKNIGGTIFIYSMFGKVAGKIEVPPQIITASSNRNLMVDSGEKILWNEKFPFGFYTAKAVLSYENSPTVTKEKSFIVLPLIPLLITVVLLFFILGVSLRVLRKVNLKEK